MLTRPAGGELHRNKPPERSPDGSFRNGSRWLADHQADPIVGAGSVAHCFFGGAAAGRAARRPLSHGLAGMDAASATGPHDWSTLELKMRPAIAIRD